MKISVSIISSLFLGSFLFCDTFLGRHVSCRVTVEHCRCQALLSYTAPLGDSFVLIGLMRDQVSLPDESHVYACTRHRRPAGKGARGRLSAVGGLELTGCKEVRK